MAEARTALTAEAQGPAVADAGRDGDLDRLAVGHGDGAPRAFGGVEEIHLGVIAKLRPAGVERLTMAVFAAALTAPEYLGEEVRRVLLLAPAEALVVALPRVLPGKW